MKRLILAAAVAIAVPAFAQDAAAPAASDAAAPATAPTDTPASVTTVSVDTSITRTFVKAGTFTFHCTVHAGMTGKVIVADQISGTNTAPPPGYGGP